MAKAEKMTPEEKKQVREKKILTLCKSEAYHDKDITLAIGVKLTKSEWDKLVAGGNCTQEFADLCMSDEYGLLKKTDYMPKGDGEPRKRGWADNAELALVGDAFMERLKVFVTENEKDLEVLSTAGYHFQTYFRNENAVGTKKNEAEVEAPAPADEY